MKTFDGLDLHVRVHGPDDAPVTVLLAHCWTSDLDDWRYQVRDLMAAYGHGIRILTWDHRGHGASDESPREACTVANVARDMGDLIDLHAPKGPLVLAGHSLGGMAMLALAEQRPELVRDRVVGAMFVSTSSCEMDTVTLGLPEPGERLKSKIPYLLAARSRLLSSRQRRRLPVIERQVVRRFLFGSPMRLRDAALATEGIINSPAATMVGFYEDFMEHDRRAACSTYDGIPTRVLVGDRDVLTPPHHGRKIASSIPSARFTVAPGAGHMLPLERDELVSTVLIGLVADALPQTPHPRHVADVVPQHVADVAPHPETVGPVASGGSQAAADEMAATAR